MQKPSMNSRAAPFWTNVDVPPYSAPSTSQAHHIPERQDLPGSSAAGLRYPDCDRFVNQGVAPPPYSAVDGANQFDNSYIQSQPEVVQHITVIAVDDTPSPCCNCCSWMCWRKPQYALAIVCVIAASIKLILFIVGI